MTGLIMYALALGACFVAGLGAFYVVFELLPNIFRKLDILQGPATGPTWAYQVGGVIMVIVFIGAVIGAMMLVGVFFSTIGMI